MSVFIEKAVHGTNLERQMALNALTGHPHLNGLNDDIRDTKTTNNGSFLKICSLVCIILAGVLFPRERLYVISIILVLAVSSAFWFITAIDVISWLLRERIRFKSWLMIAMTGFLMYCLCAGFMFKTGRGSKALMLALGVTSLVTAILFLIDVLWIAYNSISGASGKFPRRDTVRPFTNEYGDSVDRAVSVCFLLDVNEYECPKMRRRYGVTVKPLRKDATTPSYGGTFPVSKEFVPLSSPETKSPISDRRSIFSNVPSRPSRRVSMSPSRKMSTSPSRKSASPSRYENDDEYFSTATTSEDPYQQPRVSAPSYSPDPASARRNQLDTVPETESSMRTKKSRFDDQGLDVPSRRQSDRSRYEYPERDRPNQDYRSQRSSTRAGNLDTVPEQEDPRSSRASDRRSASSRRNSDDQSRYSRY